MDINELAQNILKQEDERLAKAFTMCIGGLLVSNGIQPILNKTCGEWSENDDLNKYIMRREYQVTFDIDTTEHDKQIRVDAINEALQIIHNIYTQDLYCDVCDRDNQGYDCEDCLYKSIKQNLEQLKQK